MINNQSFTTMEYFFLICQSENNFRVSCVPRGTFCFSCVMAEKALLSNIFESKFKPFININCE